jgi:hypothetical protein
VAPSLQAALRLAQLRLDPSRRVFVIGGAQLYREAMSIYEKRPEAATGLADAMTNLANVFSKLGQPKEAIPLADAALDIPKTIWTMPSGSAARHWRWRDSSSKRSRARWCRAFKRWRGLCGFAVGMRRWTRHGSFSRAASSWRLSSTASRA